MAFPLSLVLHLHFSCEANDIASSTLIHIFGDQLLPFTLPFGPSFGEIVPAPTKLFFRVASLDFRWLQAIVDWLNYFYKLDDCFIILLRCNATIAC